MAGQATIFVSACLMGANCTYNGKNKLHSVFARMCSQGEAIAACPEVLGGFEIPHSPSEIAGGDGYDVLEGDAKVLSLHRKVYNTFLSPPDLPRKSKRLGPRKSPMTGDKKSSPKAIFLCEGKDVTELFFTGARRVLDLFRKQDIKKAILKSRSPSCGCGQIYDGTFLDRLIPGDGVTTALLRMNGIEVMSDTEYLKVKT